MANLRQVVEGMYVGEIDLNGQLALDSVLEFERRLSVLAYGSRFTRLTVRRKPDADLSHVRSATRSWLLTTFTSRSLTSVFCQELK